MMVRVGGRDGHPKVGTHPPGATGLHFPVWIERRAQYVAVQVAGLLLEESCLVGMRVGHPILEDVIDRGRDCGRTCASSPFNDGRRVTRSSHLHQRHIRSSCWEIFPPILQKTRRGEGNMMALTPQMRWARVPSTHPRGMVRPLEPRASDRRPKALCSPVVGKGRLVPTTLFGLSSGETVEAPARMPAQGGAATPSCGGREGINGSGVSRRPEANRRNASFVYYSSRRKKEIMHLINHQPLRRACRDDFYRFFKWANDAMAAPPPPR
jgi:hypothetical protein